MLLALALFLATSQETLYVEFLWNAPPKGASARAEALVLVKTRGQSHRICVVAPVLVPSATLRIEAEDSKGALVSVREYPGYDGKKRCYAPALTESGSPGNWVFRFYVDGVLVGKKSIEVAERLAEARQFSMPGAVLILGRPNYNPEIPANAYTGQIVWEMIHDRRGIVREVRVTSAVGAGEQMRERALAAGYLSRFAPIAAEAGEWRTVSQQYGLGSN